VIKYELTHNEDVDYFIDDFLKECGFEKKQDVYIYSNKDIVQFNKRIKWVVDKFYKDFRPENVDVCEPIKNSLVHIKDDSDLYERALTIGEQIKNKKTHEPRIASNFKRTLMDYQKESVEHMMEVGNAANFSVPGSGKTTITYAAISRWLEDGIIEKIFVIGPIASFLPWEEEYQSCFNKKVRRCRVTGELASEFPNLGESYDLFLMHFNTAMGRIWELQNFMQKWKTVLIVDESHNIKSPQLGRWASTALTISPYAKRRVILSGTPMPNDARDLWTQITFLWPNNFPLGNQMIYNNYANKNGIGKYKPVLDKLFCRIKKNDLNLPKPEWVPHHVKLNTRQQEIYDVIAAKTLKEIDSEMNIHEQAKLQKFRMIRMIRLLQTASNPSLLLEMASEYDVNSPTFSEEFGLAPTKLKMPRIETAVFDKIANYSKYEMPSKMVKAAQLARDFYEKGNKVIIWNSFKYNMLKFQFDLLKDLNPIMINGDTPMDLSVPGNRDTLISEFKNSKEPKILIASAASLGESVSLHKNLMGEKVCNHAIYLDRNFNGAQYMQSMDRIHRIGMDESAKVEYHLIIAEDTIDDKINSRLNEKWTEMLDALNDDMLESVDINPEPEKMNVNEFNKDYQAMVEHLRKIYGNK
jgi:SNF2 family DNA or RNA helicase